jgi:hypothetical protein
LSNCREPLARFPFASGQFHPAAASPSSNHRRHSFVTALQSISLDPLSQGPQARKFFSSSPADFPATPSIYSI